MLVRGRTGEARGREKEKRSRDEMATWPALCCFEAPFRSSLFPQNPRTFQRFPFAFLLFFFSPNLMYSFSHYRDEPTMKITSVVVVSYTLRKPIIVRSLSLLDVRLYVVYVNTVVFFAFLVKLNAPPSRKHLQRRPIRKVSSNHRKRVLQIIKPVFCHH